MLGNSLTQIFKDNGKPYRIYLEIVSIEAHHKIDLVERNHGVVRQVYKKLIRRDPITPNTVFLANTICNANELVETLLNEKKFPEAHFLVWLPTQKSFVSQITEKISAFTRIP